MPEPAPRPRYPRYSIQIPFLHEAKTPAPSNVVLPETVLDAIVRTTPGLLKAVEGHTTRYSPEEARRPNTTGGPS
jgi:hypothetical protein